MGEGLFPVRGDLPLDEAALGFPLGAAAKSAFLEPVSGSLVLDVADRQPEQLDDRIIGGEVATVLDDLPQLVVQRLAFVV